MYFLDSVEEDPRLFVKSKDPQTANDSCNPQMVVIGPGDPIFRTSFEMPASGFHNPNILMLLSSKQVEAVEATKPPEGVAETKAQFRTRSKGVERSMVNDGRRGIDGRALWEGKKGLDVAIKKSESASQSESER